MKITLINGCDINNDFYNEICGKIHRDLNEKQVIYSVNNLYEFNLKSCKGCDCCQSIKPGICAINDGINDILKDYINSDIAIIITTIRYGTCNSITKKFIDKTQPLFLPYQVKLNGKTKMKSRYDNYPDIICVGISDNVFIESNEAFKNFFEECNLSRASKNVKVKIINNKLDLEEIKFLD